nr:hypothetical protein [Tanacetum cinerariifolium]
MQQDGHGSVISHSRRLFTDQLASAKGDPGPQAEIDALEERMRLWFVGEVPEIVQLRGMVVRCRTCMAERTVQCRSLIYHLEHMVGRYPTSSWLRRLRANQAKDLHLFGMINAFVARLYEGARTREQDLVDMDY